MSCNSCSNVTLPGVPGPTGAPGVPGAPGANGANGADGADGANGADGVDGAVLLKSIGAESADYTSNTYGPPVISTGDGFPWVVTANTLSTDLDTLRLEGLAVFTQGDATKQLRIQADLVDVNVGVASYPLQGSGDIVGCKFVVDFVRTSSDTLRVESDCAIISNPQIFDYATSEISGFPGFQNPIFNVFKNNQTITVSSDMGSNDFSIGLDILTTNAAQPLKLVNCKLLKFKKV